MTGMNPDLSTAYALLRSRDIPGSMLETWVNRAACRDADPETFYPEGSERMRAAQEEVALSYCARCEVRAECRTFVNLVEYPQGVSQWHGIWGGWTVEDRKRIRRVQMLQHMTLGKMIRDVVNGRG